MAHLNKILADLFRGTNDPRRSISLSTVARLLEEIDYHLSMGVRYQKKKLQVENVSTYLHHVMSVLEIPFSRLKFVDNIDFISKGA